MVLLVTEKGFGKRTPLTEFNIQNRGGKGLKSMDGTDKKGRLVDFRIVSEGDELMMLTSEGTLIRLEAEDISVQKRYSQGVMLMRLAEEDRIVSIARFKAENEQ